MTRLPAATLLGQNVRRLCKMQGASLDALAERLDWSEKILADLKAGSLDLTLDQLDELCAALAVTPQSLFDDAVAAENQAQELRYG